MRPAADCTAPPHVHWLLVAAPQSPDGGGGESPASTLNGDHSVVVVLPPRLALSLATTCHAHDPVVNPVRSTPQTSVPTSCPAANDWVLPEGVRITNVTLFTPLASVTVARNPYETPIVTPAAGSIPETVGGVLSSPPPPPGPLADGRTAGAGWAPAGVLACNEGGWAARVWPCAVRLPSARRR
jgi:hypothetical protein